MNHKSHRGFPENLSSVLIAAALGLISSWGAQAAETTLAWDPNKEADVVGYQIHYGSSSGTYDQVLDVGNSTTATVPNLSNGTKYFFVVTAYNSTGLTSQHSNEVSTQLTNSPPVVNLEQPTAGSTFPKHTKITLVAAASDQDGSIAKLEFYASGAKVGEDDSAPYSAVWNANREGVYNVLARATDNQGSAISSEPISVEITNGGNGGGKKGPATFTTLIESTAPNREYAGSITLTTTDAGAYSGKIKHEGISYTVKGRLNADGKATKQISRKGKSPLVLTIESGGSDSAELTGTLSDGTTSSNFTGTRSAGKGDQANRNAGRWVILLPSREPTSGETAYPQGTSFATLVISKKGSARLTGTLADGRQISQGGQLSEAGGFPFYVALYGKQGTIAGTAVFPSTNEAPKTLTGSVEWFKPPGLNKERLHAEGFDLTLDILGELAPKAQGGGAVDGPRDGSSAKELALFGGNLAKPINRRITVRPNGGLQTSPGDERLKIQIRPNGKFSGSFLDATTSKRRHFIGATLETRGVGAGFFLGTTEGGGVLLETVE